MSLGNNSNFFRIGGEPPSSAAQFCLIRPFFRTISARLHAKLRTDKRRLRVGSGRRSIIDSKRKSVRQLADRRHSVGSRVCHKRERLCRYRPNSDPGMKPDECLPAATNRRSLGRLLASRAACAGVAIRPLAGGWPCASTHGPRHVGCCCPREKIFSVRCLVKADRGRVSCRTDRRCSVPHHGALPGLEALRPVRAPRLRRPACAIRR